MSRADNIAEMKAYQEKFFDYAESPIKEWLSDYLGKPVEEVFNDYEDESEIIGFMYDNKHYKAYLIPMPADTENLVSKAIMIKSEKAKKACSMLFDSVLEVFMAVTGSMDHTPESEELKSFIPMFVEQRMAFQLKRVNRKAMQLQVADQQRKQIEQFLKTADQTGVSQEQKDMIQESLNQINVIFKENTKEVLDAEEELCKTTNEKTIKKMWLHIALEETDESDDDIANESMKRLPAIGLEFQDPEEENYIDKLKKEHGVE